MQEHHPKKQKMAQFYGLSDEIWTFIITLLAISADGATSLACLSATCHKFYDLTRNPRILKVVSFEGIYVDEYEEHRHSKDLLCLCARAGNPAAESMLGKALMHNDAFFWRMIVEHDLPLLAQNALAGGLLLPRKLVRRFISHASDQDISVMRIPLFTYVISILGYDMAEFCGILLAVANMCSFYLENSAEVVNDVYTPPLLGLNTALALLTPPSSEAHRALVLEIFDAMFTGVH